jgi:death-on-curing protein
VTAWHWLGLDLVLAVHDEQLAEHGGRPGLRDRGSLESALAGPRHLATYASPDAFDLAAAYAHGLARNHPFIDGNKRTAFVSAATFLYDHGHDLDADDAETVRAVLELAAGRMGAAAFAAWLRARARPVENE